MIIFAMSDKTDSLNFIRLDVLMLILMAKVRILMICFRQDWDADLCGLGSLPPGEDFRTIFAKIFPLSLKKRGKSPIPISARKQKTSIDTTLNLFVKIFFCLSSNLHCISSAFFAPVNNGANKTSKIGSCASFE